MPSVTRPARDDSHRAIVEQQVLEAVERLLAGGESFTSLPIQRIAAEAGMARTTFYGHFRDKPSLLVRLTESATLRLFAAAADWVRDPASTREDLDDTLAQLISEYRKHRSLLRAVNELASYEPAVEDYWRAAIDAFAALLSERIARDQAAGLIPAGVSATTTATWIAWGTERTIAMHVAAHPTDTRSDPALATGIAAATWAAMQRV
jgi:TetR/AcrR family transcriptional regulator, ethionamide resistance regulator